MKQAECIWALGAVLGEGPLWREAEQALYLVDIKGRRLHRWQQADGARASWGLSEMTGWVLPCAHDAGLLAGLQSGIAYLDFAPAPAPAPAPAAAPAPAPAPAPAHAHALPDQLASRAGKPAPALNVRWLHRLHAPGSRLRLNDAKADRFGNVWFGTMDHVQEGNPVGELFRLNTDGKIERFDTGYGVTNGPAFSPDGRTLYHTDSARRTVYAFDLDQAGVPHNKRVWHQFEAADGYPDGMAVDTAGCVWIAFWDGARIARFAASGQLLASVPMPVMRPTSLAFGGADFRTLFITSARAPAGADLHGSDALLQGGLFRLRVDVPGAPALGYGGRLKSGSAAPAAAHCA